MQTSAKGCKFVGRKRKEKKRKEKKRKRGEKKTENTALRKKRGKKRGRKKLQRKQQRISKERNQNSQAMMFPKITNYPRKRRRIKM